MILYQHVSPFRNFLNFLAANGFSIGGSSRHQLLAIKAIIRQNRLQGARSAQDHDWKGANHSLDPQDTQVCSSCLSELGAVCARLVSKLPTIPNDLMLFGRSFRSCSFEHVNSSGGPAKCRMWGLLGNGWAAESGISIWRRCCRTLQIRERRAR